MQEIEVKFMGIDPAEMQKRIEGIGATKVRDFFYRRRVFDYPDFRLDTDHAWVRLRDEGEKIMLCYKQRQGVTSENGDDKGMEEIEVEVKDFDLVTAIMLKIGLIEKHYAENKRSRWKKDGVEFDIDIWPSIPPYLEIEAQSMEEIDAAIAELGLDPQEKKVFSGNQIYKMYGIDVSALSRITFEGLVKRS